MSQFGANASRSKGGSPPPAKNHMGGDFLIQDPNESKPPELCLLKGPLNRRAKEEGSPGKGKACHQRGKLQAAKTLHRAKHLENVHHAGEDLSPSQLTKQGLHGFLVILTWR